jgi:hypothetical protein
MSGATPEEVHPKHHYTTRILVDMTMGQSAGRRPVYESLTIGIAFVDIPVVRRTCTAERPAQDGLQSVPVRGGTSGPFRMLGNVGQVANPPETRQIGNLPHVGAGRFYWCRTAIGPSPTAARVACPRRGSPCRASGRTTTPGILRASSGSGSTADRRRPATRAGRRARRS